ncbi:unnamed protein product [Vicia faba]|uniref:Uncharacterized protein n=1 Tax=Vicia faba TaxID=3906 RepID=A0AAV0ZP98_VICFA|nr:unnamed protein product [Vicia faba]
MYPQKKHTSISAQKKPHETISCQYSTEKKESISKAVHGKEECQTRYNEKMQKMSKSTKQIRKLKMKPSIIEKTEKQNLTKFKDVIVTCKFFHLKNIFKGNKTYCRNAKTGGSPNNQLQDMPKLMGLMSSK